MASTVGRLSPVPSPRGARPASLAFENDLSSAYTLRVSKRTGDDSSTFSTIAPGENWTIPRPSDGVVKAILTDPETLSVWKYRGRVSHRREVVPLSRIQAEGRHTARRKALVFLGIEPTSDFLIFGADKKAHAEIFQESVIHSLLYNHDHDEKELGSSPEGKGTEDRERRVVETIGVSQLTALRTFRFVNRIDGSEVDPATVLGDIQGRDESDSSTLMLMFLPPDALWGHMYFSPPFLYDDLWTLGDIMRSSVEYLGNRVVSGGAIVRCIVALRSNVNLHPFFKEDKSRLELLEEPEVTFERMLRMGISRHEKDACFHLEPNLRYKLPKTQKDCTRGEPKWKPQAGSHFPDSPMLTKRGSIPEDDFGGFSVIKEGYLLKQKKTSSKYQERYFRLIRLHTPSLTPFGAQPGCPMIPGGLGDFSLRWYSNSKTPKIKGEVVITGAEVETDPDDETGFQVISNGRNLLLRAVSQAERAVWIRELSGILASNIFSSVPLRAPPVLLKRLPTLAKVNIVPTVRDTQVGNPTPYTTPLSSQIFDSSTENESTLPSHVYIDLKLHNTAGGLGREIEGQLIKIKAERSEIRRSQQSAMKVTGDAKLSKSTPTVRVPDDVLYCEEGPVREALGSALKSIAGFQFNKRENLLYLHPTPRLRGPYLEKTWQKSMLDGSAPLDILTDCIVLTDQAVLLVCQGVLSKRMSLSSVQSVKFEESDFRTHLHIVFHPKASPSSPFAKGKTNLSHTAIYRTSMTYGSPQGNEMEKDASSSLHPPGRSDWQKKFTGAYRVPARSYEAAYFIVKRIRRWLVTNSRGRGAGRSPFASGQFFVEGVPPLHRSSGSKEVAATLDKRKKGRYPSPLRLSGATRVVSSADVSALGSPNINGSSEGTCGLNHWLSFGDPRTGFSVELHVNDHIDLLKIAGASEPEEGKLKQKAPLILAMGKGNRAPPPDARGRGGYGPGWCAVKLRQWSGWSKVAINCSASNGVLKLYRRPEKIVFSAGNVPEGKHTNISLAFLRRLRTKPEKLKSYFYGLNHDGTGAEDEKAVLALAAKRSHNDDGGEGVPMTLMWSDSVDYARFVGQILVLHRIYALRRSSKNARKRSPGLTIFPTTPTAKDDQPDVDTVGRGEGEAEMVYVEKALGDGIGAPSLHRVAIRLQTLHVISPHCVTLCRVTLLLRRHTPLRSREFTLYPPASPRISRLDSMVFLPSEESPEWDRQSSKDHLSPRAKTKKGVEFDAKVGLKCVFALHLASSELGATVLVETRPKHDLNAEWEKLGWAALPFSACPPESAKKLKLPLHPADSDGPRGRRTLNVSDTQGTLDVELSRVMSVMSHFEIAEASPEGGDGACPGCGTRTRALNYFSGWACTKCGRVSGPSLNAIGHSPECFLPVVIRESRRSQKASRNHGSQNRRDSQGFLGPPGLRASTRGSMRRLQQTLIGSTPVFNPDRLGHAMHHLAYKLRDMEIMFLHSSLLSLVNWRKPLNSLFFVVLCLTAIFALKWTWLLAVAVIVMILNYVITFGLMHGIHRWHSAPYSLNFQCGCTLPPRRVPLSRPSVEGVQDRSKIRQNPSDSGNSKQAEEPAGLDSLHTELVLIEGHKKGEYTEVRVGGDMGAAIVDVRIRHVLSEDPDHKALHWGYFGDCLWVHGKLRAEFYVTYRSRPFLSVLQTLAEGLADTFARIRSLILWIDQRKSMIFLVSLCALALAITALPPSILLALIVLIEMFKAPLVWHYNRYSRSRLAERLRDPATLLSKLALPQESLCLSDAMPIRDSVDRKSLSQGSGRSSIASSASDVKSIMSTTPPLRVNYGIDPYATQHHVGGVLSGVPNHTVAMSVPVSAIGRLLANFLAGCPATTYQPLKPRRKRRRARSLQPPGREKLKEASDGFGKISVWGWLRKRLQKGGSSKGKKVEKKLHFATEGKDKSYEVKNGSGGSASANGEVWKHVVAF